MKGRRPALLDVNVLIALAWPNHVHHRAAHAWFAGAHTAGWATTPVTESGFVRVSSNRAAIVTATSPDQAIALLGAMTALQGHAFWPDDIAGVTGGFDEPALITTHRDVTDAHLLALAQRYGGTLVTFDAKISRLLGSRDPELLSVQS